MQTPLSEPRAAYIHVPFCAHRCGYCDFTVIAGRDHLAGEYLAALERELTALETPRPVDTLFFGGGTPTHLQPRDLDRLLAMALRWLPLAPGAEFSVEANPADLTPDKCAVLAERGVTRVSLGAQSFSANLLRVLERDHEASDISGCVERLRPSIPNLSVDLIFGVPGQSLDDWESSLDQAIGLGVPHVSAYGLTYEKGTAFWTRRSQGALIAVDEELERDMYLAAQDRLGAAGLMPYELSNYARPGRECRHNQTYWSGLPYFGFGPGAASYVGGTRRTNHRSVTTWLKRVLAGESGVADSETLSPQNRAREAIWLGLRAAAGIDREAFAARFGHSLDDLAAEAIARLTGQGLIIDDGRSIRLTRAGRLLADRVAVEFL